MWALWLYIFLDILNSVLGSRLLLRVSRAFWLKKEWRLTVLREYSYTKDISSESGSSWAKYYCRLKTNRKKRENCIFYSFLNYYFLLFSAHFSHFFQLLSWSLVLTIQRHMSGQVNFRSGHLCESVHRNQMRSNTELEGRKDSKTIGSENTWERDLVTRLYRH